MLLKFILSTLNQRDRRVHYKRKPQKRRPRLQACPQRRAYVIRPRIVTPRKPNSARRPVAKVRLSNYLKVTAHIPGTGHTIKRYNKVYVRGGGARDLPGVRYSLVRGVLDCGALKHKTKRRSIYGVEKPRVPGRHIRRKNRIKKIN